MPIRGENILKFIHHCRAFKHPFHVIADFESTLKKCDQEYEDLNEEEKEKIKTIKHRSIFKIHLVLNIIVFMTNILNLYIYSTAQNRKK